MGCGNPSRFVGDVAIIHLDGKLRLGDGTERLREQVRDLIEGGRTSVILEMEHLTYVDSSGLGALVGCFTSVRKAGGALKLLRLNPKVRDQLLMMKLFAIFEVFDEEAAAVASFAKAAGTAPGHSSRG